MNISPLRSEFLRISIKVLYRGIELSCLILFHSLGLWLVRLLLVYFTYIFIIRELKLMMIRDEVVAQIIHVRQPRQDSILLLLDLLIYIDIHWSNLLGLLIRVASLLPSGEKALVIL